MSTISRRLALPSTIAFATLLLHCAPALAAWQHDGIPLSPPGVTAGPALGRDGTGGVFVAWANDSIHLEVHAPRVQPDGSNAPGWVYAGGAIAACLCTLTGLDTTMAEQWTGNPWPGCTAGMRVVSDGDHGAFLVWLAGTTVKVCRIDQSGDPVAGWNVNGVTVGTHDMSTSIGPSLARDETGGCFVMWPSPDGYLIQRFTAAGAIAAGWPASGAPIGAPPSTALVTQMVADGTGGVYVGWGMLAQHLGPSGSPAPGWLATGDPICQAVGTKTNLTAYSIRWAAV